MASELHVDAIKHSGGTSALTIDSSGNVHKAGMILQTVIGTTSTKVTFTSSSYVDTNITATITPKFNTSKILILSSMAFDTESNGTIFGKLLRGSTNIKEESFFGYFSADTSEYKVTRESHTFLDSPATTSSTTYKWQVKVFSGGGTHYMQWDDNNGHTESNIILQEIAQ